MTAQGFICVIFLRTSLFHLICRISHILREQIIKACCEAGLPGHRAGEQEGGGRWTKPQDAGCCISNNTAELCQSSCCPNLPYNALVCLLARTRLLWAFIDWVAVQGKAPSGQQLHSGTLHTEHRQLSRNVLCRNWHACLKKKKKLNKKLHNKQQPKKVQTIQTSTLMALCAWQESPALLYARINLSSTFSYALEGHQLQLSGSWKKSKLVKSTVFWHAHFALLSMPALQGVLCPSRIH